MTDIATFIPPRLDDDWRPTRPRLVETAVAALALGVTQATIRKLRQRGRLTRHGTTARAQYDLDELQAIADTRTDDTTQPT
ncbi:MAG TPA: hypothetical protein VFM54_23405 [Micromonosporaceae bacterium]|nr:hypothetical protein [Micromonosporaceae bacterium]